MYGLFSLLDFSLIWIRIGGSRLALLSLANCRFQFKKRSQLFFAALNETFSVAAMRVNDPEMISQ